MQTPIILIGPIGTGKSTQGKLISEKLEIPHYPMDDLRWEYYKEIGYDEEYAKQLGDRGGFVAKYWYWKPFEAHAVERILADHPDGVIDFGGGHSIFEDEARFERMTALLEPYENIVLLLPSPDLDESVRILRERTGGVVSNDLDFDDHFTRHPSNHALAKRVHYTKDKTPEETRDEIIANLR